jgi:hypothetical protein
MHPANIQLSILLPVLPSRGAGFFMGGVNITPLNHPYRLLARLGTSFIKDKYYDLNLWRI